MSPAKQKTNEKQGARDRKSLSRQAPPSAGIGASAYNPASGTFHALESISSDPPGAVFLNGRFRTIDDTDDLNGGGAEFECMSNNGSCSGESEDQLHANGKEKHGAGKLGSSPGLVAGADKRDKIRGKNERKHQRQKERRAQELRDKCTSYLMSRKLESLSQQLVAMGFSQERATMALILNDGHVEQSVAWLLEGGEGQVHEDWNTGGNPKIDISEELNHIVEIEKKYRFSRPEIERAIVSFEGDLDKALDSLRARSQSTSPTRTEGHSSQDITKDVPAISKETPLSVPAAIQSPVLTQQRVSNGLQSPYQARKEDKGVTYAKIRQQGFSVSSHTVSDGPTKAPAQGRKSSTTVMNMPRSLSPGDTRGFTHSARSAPGSHKTTSNYVTRSDTGLTLGSSGTDTKIVSAPGKDPFVNSSIKDFIGSGQLSSATSTQVTPAVSTCPVSSSPMFSSPNWSRGFMDMAPPSSVLFVNSTTGDMGIKSQHVGKKMVEPPGTGGASAIGFYNSLNAGQPDPLSSPWTWAGNAFSSQNSLVSSSSPLQSAAHSRSSSLTSYGLYTGWGSGLSHSSVDWSSGPMANCDYRKIDWSMSVSPSATTDGSGLRGLSNSLNAMQLQDKGMSSWNHKEERLGSVHLMTDSTNGIGVWKVGPSAAGVQDNASVDSGSSTAFGLHEWTSPFAGKDLFTLPQAVPSPSL